MILHSSEDIKTLWLFLHELHHLPFVTGHPKICKQV